MTEELRLQLWHEVFIACIEAAGRSQSFKTGVPHGDYDNYAHAVAAAKKTADSVYPQPKGQE